MGTLTASETTHLSDLQRADLMAQLDRDGYVILPQRLPEDLIEESVRAIDWISDKHRAPGKLSVKLSNCVDQDPAFRRLMMHEPALQMAYDCFGPMFQLCQSNFVSRHREVQAANDFVDGAPWHADGPRPGMFPNINGTMGLHYLKFGYFLTDLTHEGGGALQIVRGSHKRPELDGVPSPKFDAKKYANDIVECKVPAGTIVAFHQAQWHAAEPNRSDIVRKNVYISYCPTWMKPLDREYPTLAQLEGLSAEERWILGEPRPALRWWLPTQEDSARMSRFKRDGNASVGTFKNYD